MLNQIIFFFFFKPTDIVLCLSNFDSRHLMKSVYLNYSLHSHTETAISPL